MTRLGGHPRRVVVRRMSERDHGHDPRRGHDRLIWLHVIVRARLCTRAEDRPRLVERWSVLPRRLDAAHTLRPHVVTATGTIRHLRDENVTGASLRSVMTAPLPHAVMIAERRGEDGNVRCHRSHPRVILAHARGRPDRRCLSARTKVGPVVEVIKKIWIRDDLLLAVMTCSLISFYLMFL